MTDRVSTLCFLEDNAKNKPIEDCLWWTASSDLSRHVFAVADGVTRSVPVGGSYPDPSAWHPANIFCSQIRSLRDARWRSKDAAKKAIVDAFRHANEGIYCFNTAQCVTSETVDYFEKDYFGCVGVMGVLLDNTLHYGYIGDCGLLVFDKDLNPVFLSSNNELGPLEMFREGMVFTGAKERSIFVRRNLRNHPHSRAMTYGALTGEEGALPYVRTGSISLELQDTAILFSDGILPFIFDVQFRAVLRNQLYSGDDSVELVRKTIDILTGKLGAKHVSNLDDDKAFVAFSILGDR